MYIKTLVTHDLNVLSEILKLLSKNLQNLKPSYLINFFDALFKKNHFWPETTENMKIARKQEKVDFFVHKIKSMDNMVC